MGFFSKVWKGIKTSFVGKWVRKAFKRFGKFMNKIGVLGQIAMTFILPGVGGMMSKLASGMMKYQGFAQGLVRGAGKFINVAANVGSKIKGGISSITKGVTGAIKNTLGGMAEAMNLDGFLNKLTGRLPTDANAFDFSKFEFGGGKLTKDLQTMFTDVHKDIFSTETGIFSKDTLTTNLYDKEMALKGTQELTDKLTTDVSEQVSTKQDLDLKLDNSQIEAKFGKVGNNTIDDYGLKDFSPRGHDGWQVEGSKSFIDNNNQKLSVDITDSVVKKVQANPQFQKNINDQIYQKKMDMLESFPVEEITEKEYNIMKKNPSSILTNPSDSSKSITEKIGDYTRETIDEVTDVIKDPKKVVSYMRGKGDEAFTAAITSAASAGAQRAIMGKPQAPQYFSTNIPDLPAPSVGTEYMADTVLDASQYQQQMLAGNNWGQTAFWDQWRHFMVGNPQQGAFV